MLICETIDRKLNMKDQNLYEIYIYNLLKKYPRIIITQSYHKINYFLRLKRSWKILNNLVNKFSIWNVCCILKLLNYNSKY